MMMEKDMMEVLDKAMEVFNGIKLHFEEVIEDFDFAMSWDLYPTKKGIEIWSSSRDNKAGATWSLEEYRGTIEWEKVPELYKKELSAE